jgi:hypothetical protein
MSPFDNQRIWPLRMMLIASYLVMVVSGTRQEGAVLLRSGVRYLRGKSLFGGGRTGGT